VELWSCGTQLAKALQVILWKLMLEKTENEETHLFPFESPESRQRWSEQGDVVLELGWEIAVKS